MAKHPLFPYQLYLVISEEACQGRDFLKVAEQAIIGGVEIIQLREKNTDTPIFIEKALRLKEITERYNVPLIINDNLEVANAVQAFGIHVGNTDTPPTEIRSRWGNQLQIGYSIEYLSQLETMETATANHLGISPIFSTATKTDTVTEWGLEGIRLIRSLTDKPLIAIGNMNKTNAVSVVQAGADSIAVVSAICSAENPQKAAYELRNLITQ
ncbi:thiamine phosphate synthase [Emticicia sp. C21]|uniref:thiamine phosphate synthase n=1 Tax=Emticicia sp. C21 TaxID=2302915 RepID=UPI000E35416D|nr:thiamine phosphate synthase [Emticicia sp. C21]RFS17847.1 thiamine phosphate synthase [Emticicia sp. C21]